MKPLLLVLLLALQDREPPPPAKVSLAPAVEHGFRPVADVLGEVRPPRVTRVGAAVDGLVGDVLVDAGQVLADGQVMVTLETTRLDISVRQARAELELARQALAELNAGNREEDVREAEALVEQAEAELEQATLDRQRIEELDRQSISEKRRLDEARAREKVARATVAARAADRDRIRNGPRVEAIARAEAEVAARQATLDALLHDLTKSRIAAPFDAVVQERLVAEGAFVRRGDAVVELVQVDPIEVILFVPEEEAALVARGDEVSLSFDALPAVTRTTHVAAILPMAEEGTRTFSVRTVLENDDHRLRPGMGARGRVLLSVERRSLAVPSDALVQTPLGFAVYVSEPPTVRKVVVVPGLADGDLREVEGDLKAGDPVVVRGNERLFPGQPVIVVPGAEDAR